MGKQSLHAKYRSNLGLRKVKQETPTLYAPLYYYYNICLISHIFTSVALVLILMLHVVGAHS